MKLLVFIFSFYMLALPALPCMDTGECNEPEKTFVTQATDHNNHQDEEEACGPFCNCICCGHIVGSNSQIPRVAIEKKLPIKKIQSCYNSVSLPSDFFGNIWQPPKSV